MSSSGARGSVVGWDTLLQAGIVKSEETSIARQLLGKHIPAETNTQATVQLSSVVMQRRRKHAFSTVERLRFLRGLCRGFIKKTLTLALATNDLLMQAMTLTKDRPALSSERAPHKKNKTVTVRQY
jgi:hypothetical protein